MNYQLLKISTSCFLTAVDQLATETWNTEDMNKGLLLADMVMFIIGPSELERVSSLDTSLGKFCLRNSSP